MHPDLRNLPQPVLSLVQRGLISLGHYSGTTRGIGGPKTNAAYLDFLGPSGKSPLPELVAAAAESQIGVRETGGSNKGAELQKFFDSDWYDPNGTLPGDEGYAWCASFVCWCVKEAGERVDLPFNRPRTPGAWDFENWARREEVELIKPAMREVRRGDIVVFKFSHVGIATGDEANGRVETVEGNTNKAGSREGDGVYRKIRRKSQIRSIIRLA